MKIEQSIEKYGRRFDIQIITKDEISHKMLTESSDLVYSITDLMWDVGKAVVERINHEFQVKFPEGLKG